VRISISQPTYLPWLGYFDLIEQADVFVFLDSVQFEKRSWQQRNRIKGPDGLTLLTVPVVVKGRSEQKIQDVELSEPDFWDKHLRAIETNYGRAPFFESYFPGFASVVKGASQAGKLVDLNISIIRYFHQLLGIKTPLVRSSGLEAEGRKSVLLARICKELGASEYVSALGSACYLVNEIEEFATRSINVGFQQYEHPHYRQLFPPFHPYASVLDLVLNEGTLALEIIRSGRREMLTPEDARRRVQQGVPTS